MSARVDVLRVLDAVIRDCALSVMFGGDVRKARAAVAELIEAANEALEAGNDGDWQSARNALTAALSRIGAD